MQCATCQHPFEPDVSGDGPITCPACGAQMAPAATAIGKSAPAAAAVVAKPVKAAKAPGRARAALNDLLLSFLFVAAILVAVASTLVALKVTKERNSLKADFAASDTAVDGIVLAASTSSRLKGPVNAEARKEIFSPAINYYQYLVSTHQANPERLDDAVAAGYQLAGLQAKSGTGACVGSLQSALEGLEAMDTAEYDIARFPSLNALALKSTAPMEWAIMKDTKMEMHAMGLLVTFQGAIGTLNKLSKKHPETTVFRDDLSGLLRISATLQSAVPDRAPFALSAWIEARDLLETLVRDQPTNADYQIRLVEALMGAANFQKRDGKTDEAVANIKRAVEVRQLLVDANPDDKALAQELAKVKGDLEKLQPADAAKPEAGAAESAAAPAAEAPVQ